LRQSRKGEPSGSGLRWRDSVLILAVIAALAAAVFAQSARAANPDAASAQLLERAAQNYRQEHYAAARRDYERATQVDPGSIRAWRGLGWSLWRLGERERAAEVWSELLKVAPDDADAQLGLAQVYESREAWDDAIDVYSRMLQRDPRRVAAYVGRARVYQHFELYAQAESDLRGALALAPADFDAQFLLALLCKSTDRGDEARAIFARLARQPVESRYWRPMADVLLELDRPEEALRYYRLNLPKNPDNRGTVLGMARAEARLGEYRTGVDRLQRYVLRHDDDDGMRQELARLALSSGDYGRALKHVKVLAERHPEDMAWQVKYARTLRDAGRAEEAVQVAQRVLQDEPENTGALELLLHVAMLDGTREQVMERLEALTAAEPTVRRLVRLGNAYIRAGDEYANARRMGAAEAARGRAVEVFRQARELDPLDADAALGAATALRLAGDPAGAYALAAQLLEEHPNVERARREMYESSMERGDYRTAEELLRDWLQEQPNSLRLRQDLDLVRFRRGDRDAAIADVKQLLGEPLKRGVPVLLYHGISEASPADDTMPLRNFRDQMRALKQEGYVSIDVHRLLAFYEKGEKLPKKPVLITFDDARSDSFRYADPVLREFGFRAVMFTPTAEVGRHGEYNATWSTIRKMVRTGRWDIQCHSHAGHAPIALDADGKPGVFLANRAWLAAEERLETHEEFVARLESDYRVCAETLAREVPGVKLVGFAYPFGEYGQKALSNEPGAAPVNTELVRRHYRIGFVQDPAFETTRMSEATALERFEVPWDFTGKELVHQIRSLNAYAATQLLLADLYSWDGQYAQAQRTLDAVARAGLTDDAALLTRRGRVVMWQGNFAEARSFLVTAAELQAGNVVARQGVVELDRQTRPRLSMEGESESDNRDRGSFSLGPEQRLHFTDRLAFAAGYRYQRYGDEKFEAREIDPAATGRVALRAAGHQVEGELAYRWNWRTALALSAGVAQFEDESSATMFDPSSSFTLAALRLDAPIGEAVDVGLRGQHGYVPAAGAILDHLVATTLEGKVQARPLRNTLLGVTYTDLRYDDGNARRKAEASAMQRLVQEPELKVGYRFRYDDADRVNPFFYTPDHYTGHDAVIAAGVDAFGSSHFGAEAAVGRGQEGADAAQTEASFTANARFELGQRLSVYLNGGQSQAARFRSIEIMGGLSLMF
jgi:tetratricopeptide (TPR) repeat protein